MLPHLYFIFSWRWYLRWWLGPSEGVTQFFLIFPMCIRNTQVNKLLFALLLFCNLSRLPSWLSGKELIYQCWRCRFNPWVGKFPGGENDNPLQYSCLGNPGQRSLESYSPLDCTELDMTQWLNNNNQLRTQKELYLNIVISTPCTAACQASLSITNSQSLLTLMSIKSVMPSNHLILFHPFSSCLHFFPASRSFPMC